MLCMDSFHDLSFSVESGRNNGRDMRISFLHVHFYVFRLWFDFLVRTFLMLRFDWLR
jgi:hypothetical protein